MKCEKCNEREANFFYTATVNGETAQSRLCLPCARELGLTSAFERSFFENFGFFREPIFARAPVLTARTPAAAKLPVNIPESAGEDFKSRRELIALKHQLKAAVRDEDFERAAELRDRIKWMESAYEE